MFTHIKHTLPEITREIKEKIKEVDERLKELGPSLPEAESEKMHLLWNMITDLTSTYKNTITGRYDSKRYSANIASNERVGGAKIKMHFYSLYK